MKKLIFTLALGIFSFGITRAVELPYVGFNTCNTTICTGSALQLSYYHNDLNTLCTSGNLDPCDHIFWVIKDGSGNIIETRYVKLSDYCNGTATGLDFIPSTPGTYCVNGTRIVTCQPDTIEDNEIGQDNPAGIGNCCVSVVGPNLSVGIVAGSNCVGKEICLSYPSTGYWNMQFNWGDGTTSGYGCHTYSAPGTYWVWVTAENECGTVQTVVFVTIERCPIECDFELVADVINCNQYTFSTSYQYPFNVLNWNWTIDGQYVSSNSSFQQTLTPGTHEICVTIFATSFEDPGQAICCTKCITVDIPMFILTEEVNLEYCNLDGNNGVWFSPCNYASGNDTNYVLSGPGYAPYDSRNGYWWNGMLLYCISHHLQAGTHTVNYYNSNGCLTKVVHVNVTEKQATATYCERTEYVSCDMAVNLDGFPPPCPDCGPGEEGPWEALYVMGDETVYQREINDWANCRKCIYTLRLIRSGGPTAEHTITLSQPCLTIDLNNYLNCTFPITPSMPVVTYTEDINGVPNSAATGFFGSFYTICCEETPPGSISLYTRVFEVRDENGCMCRIRLQIICMNDGSATGGGDGGNESFLIVPNPTSEIFSIRPQDRAQDVVYTSVKILDASGVVVSEHKNATPSTEFSLAGKSAGVYVVIFTEGEKQHSLRVVLK